MGEINYSPDYRAAGRRRPAAEGLALEMDFTRLREVVTEAESALITQTAEIARLREALTYVLQEVSFCCGCLLNAMDKTAREKNRALYKEFYPEGL